MQIRGHYYTLQILKSSNKPPTTFHALRYQHNRSLNNHSLRIKIPTKFMAHSFPSIWISILYHHIPCHIIYSTFTSARDNFRSYYCIIFSSKVQLRNRFLPIAHGAVNAIVGFINVRTQIFPPNVQLLHRSSHSNLVSI